MKQYIYLLCALLGWSLYSCSNEEAALEDTGNRITVSFNLPDTNGDTRADATTPATEAEKALKKVDLYCFDYANGQAGVLKDIISLSNPTGATGISLAKGGYHIEAIANETTLNLTVGNSTYEDFKVLRANTDNYAEWLGTDGIKMQGSQKTRVTNATTDLHINFTLIRMVGRIDVVNKVEGLTLTKAVLENSVKESFYLEDETSIIAQEENSTETRENNALNVAYEGSSFLFYTYEGAVEHSKLQVSFEGTDENGTVHKSLPVVEFENQNAQPAIKRNKLYVVTLTQVDGDIQASVSVTDWNQKNIDAEVTVDDALQVEAVDVKEPVTLEGKNPATVGDAVTVNLPAAATTLSFQTTGTIEVEVIKTTDAADWLTIAPTTRALIQDFNLTATENSSTEAERSAQFVVRNKLTGKVAVTYTVVQAKAEKEEPIEPEEPKFDWSNKPAITVSGAATLEQWADSKDAVGSNGKEFFMYAIESPAVDANSPVTDFDKKGGYWSTTNDPSEEGYHMATKADWQALSEVSQKAGYGAVYLTLNGNRYYISTNSKGSNKVKIVFQACDEDGNNIGEQKTIEFGGEGSILTQHKSTSPWNCTSARLNNVTRYWCGGGTAYYVDLSYSVAVQSVDFGTNSSKGIGWYAMRIRSIKNK